ncbi:all trans-polyprenyl-diphosphate synthase PDSS1-like isoform X1 [Watersipora subatra]|uniref:all trans-polyprenyl-diphosphate synthase PDSS1-like isoform X1 n=1 Tax=Watersipora subatra TaxID=2589382 RepID=UPI00355B87C8
MSGAICSSVGRLNVKWGRICKRCTAKLTYSTQERIELHPPKYSTADVFRNIQNVLNTDSALLRDISHYHFNGLGKAVRPTIILTAAQAFNYDSSRGSRWTATQEQLVVAMVAEMIHTASLVHDDIIDESLSRRGNPSAFARWGQLQGTITGDYIMSTASLHLSRLRHNRVMQLMSQILEDLVQGEFMQLGTKANEDERFNHYIEKSYRKTASLLANSCQAATVLANTTEDKIKLAYEYGKNLGILFQLVDDALDYESTEQDMGKPTGADLKLGLATAPVLFAAHEFPRLNSLILRRFSQDGDVEEALHLVKQSCGLEQTRSLASRYGKKAIRVISDIRESEHSHKLIEYVQQLLDRTK